MKKEKVVSRGKNIVMTRRGKKAFRGMCRYCGEHGIMENPIEYFANNVLPIGAKTLKRRLCDDDWVQKHLVILQQTIQDKELQEDIDKEFREAFNAE